MLSEQADCQPEHVHIESELLEEHDDVEHTDEHLEDEHADEHHDDEHAHKDEEEHEDDVHSEFHVEYEFKCECYRGVDSKFRSIYLTLFPATEILNVQLLTLNQQTALTLN